MKEIVELNDKDLERVAGGKHPLQVLVYILPQCSNRVVGHGLNPLKER